MDWRCQSPWVNKWDLLCSAGDWKEDPEKCLLPFAACQRWLRARREDRFSVEPWPAFPTPSPKAAGRKRS